MHGSDPRFSIIAAVQKERGPEGVRLGRAGIEFGTAWMAFSSLSVATGSYATEPMTMRPSTGVRASPTPEMCLVIDLRP